MNISADKVHYLIEVLTVQKDAHRSGDGKFWWCPNCGNRIYGKTGSHCNWCGQLIRRMKA